MTQTPTRTSPWRPCFVNPFLNLAAYLTVLVCAAGYVLWKDTHTVYVILFIVTSIWYGASCGWLAAKGVPGIDVHVASDAIITCGIASLILHVAIAGHYVDSELARNRGFSEDIVRQIARVFADGLACAAAAPVIAMVLRFTEARRSNGLEADTPFAGSEALGELAQNASSVALSMTALSEAIDDSADEYESAASRVTACLETLATSVQERSQLISRQLAELEARIGALNDSVAKSSDGFTKVGTEIDDFSGKLRAGGALLDGLRDLIGSVDHFIRPHTDADSDSGKS
jgi:hypothetical protein